MQSTSWETLGWRKHKLESRLPGEISITSDVRWHHLYGRKWRGTKEPLDESERGEWKSWLKAQHSENEDHGIQSHHFMTNKWGNSGNSGWRYISGLQNHFWASLVAQRLKHLPAMQETWVPSLGREDPLEKEMATHCSILAWRIPWMEEPGWIQSQRVGHDWTTSLSKSLQMVIAAMKLKGAYSLAGKLWPTYTAY